MSDVPAKRLKVCDPDGKRKTGLESEIMALYTPCSPIEDVSPYHAFAKCPPSALFGKPAKWPGPEANATTARLLWNTTALYVCWELEGPAAAPIEASSVAAGCLEALQGGRVQPSQRSVLLDERVECFLWQPLEGQDVSDLVASRQPDAKCGGTYFAFEINHAGKALTNRADFGGDFDFHWPSQDAYSVWTRALAVGGRSSATSEPSAADGQAPPLKRIVVAAFHWDKLGINVDRDIRIGLHRAEHPSPKPQADDDDLGSVDQAEVDRILKGMVWSSWVDPGDEEVNFHRPAFFGKLVLSPK